MTTANHAITGSIIGLAISVPAIALPLAFLSHFVLDALPHFGNTNGNLNPSETFRKYLMSEALGLVGIVLLLTTGIYGWNFVTLAALVAIIPDIEWPIRHFLFMYKGIQPPATVTSALHERIQTLEREWAAGVEVAFFIISFVTLKIIL